MGLDDMELLQDFRDAAVAVTLAADFVTGDVLFPDGTVESRIGGDGNEIRLDANGDRLGLAVILMEDGVG